MERETTKFKTPGGHEVILKTYLTAREANQLKQVLYASINMSMTDLASGKTEIKDIPATSLLEQEREALKTVIVSLDGSQDNVAERLLDLPSDEYDAVVAEVNKVTKSNFQTAK